LKRKESIANARTPKISDKPEQAGQAVANEGQKLKKPVNTGFLCLIFNLKPFL
jgi:hypothetical protein